MIAFFRRASVRFKLIVAMMVTALAALLVATAAMTVYELGSYTNARTQDIETQTELLGAASIAALSFQDPGTAEENLGVLRHRPSIAAAGIYDDAGRLFATYSRDGGDTFPARPGAASTTIDGAWLLVFKDIVHNEEVIGSAYMRAEFPRLERMADYLMIAGLAALAALLMALLFALGLQRGITRPILLINRAARDVVDHHEYKLRAEKVTDDEIGTLAESFNLMLDEIHARTSELQELNENLERRIRERTAELERSNLELQSFSYTVSHDLRSPLRAIAGFTQALRTRLPDELDEESAAYFDRIRAAVRRMGQRIDGLLNLAHLSRHQLARQDVDLGELASEVLADIRQREPDRTADVRISDDLKVRGDPTLLRALIDNLLENAWKFTAHTDSARIEVGVEQQEGRRAYFVRDNGAGFDMKFADKLFQPFQRVHATPEFPGTGIGLATVKRIVERHGGRVWAEAAPAQGATFYFTLAGGWRYT